MLYSRAHLCSLSCFLLLILFLVCGVFSVVLGGWFLVLVYALVGAVIGYVTNVVAVKLLFYPERPIGFGWFRFQGLIPARRREVAERVLGAVRDYVSVEDVERLLREAFAGVLSRGVGREYLKRAVLDAVERRFRGSLAHSIYSSTRDVLTSSVASLFPALDTPIRAFAKSLEDSIVDAIRGALSRVLDDVVDEVVRCIDFREVARCVASSIDLDSLVREKVECLSSRDVEALM
ncbi:MAG: hypothetical protein DRJ40_09475 [Thermoprotei archaeon]|nr:MAG: hypothetical protein DRJ40_09475 [Thermoprotei archaeon]